MKKDTKLKTLKIKTIKLKTIKLIQSIGICFFLQSCASQIEIISPASHFLIPEVKGEFGEGNVAITTLNGTMLGITFDASAADPKYNVGPSSVAFGGFGEIGLFDTIDFYIKASTHSPTQYGFKIQLKGEPQKHTYRENSSLAFNFSAGQARYTANGNENVNIGGSATDFKLNRSHSSVHMGLGYGYRFRQDLLSYIHIDKNIEDVHGVVEYDGSAVDGTKIALTGEHITLTLGTALFYGKVNLYGELGLQQTSWTGSSDKKKIVANFGLGAKI